MTCMNSCLRPVGKSKEVLLRWAEVVFLLHFSYAFKLQFKYSFSLTIFQTSGLVTAFSLNYVVYLPFDIFSIRHLSLRTLLYNSLLSTLFNLPQLAEFKTEKVSKR